jgi:hypothetical protein
LFGLRRFARHRAEHRRLAVKLLANIEVRGRVQTEAH